MACGISTRASPTSRQSDVTLASGVRAGGTPLHDLSLRITIDRELTIVDAEAASDAVPYPGYCDIIGPPTSSWSACR